MKYLSESKSTLDTLRKHGGHWKVLHFFFDYRSGKNTANHILGLLKLFIRQIVEQIPKLADRLSDEHTRRKIAGEDTSTHLDVLAYLVQSCDVRICAFIDGLDEYDGDAWELCAKLEALRDRTEMKICVASRPEVAFETTFAKAPTLIMQEHNMASIKLYIRQKINQFRSLHPFQSHLLPESLQEAVAEKAQGVILWARLVIDEMMKNCDPSTVPEDLIAYLDSSPPGMEPLYERMLGKPSQEHQQEAAVLLMLVDEDTDTIDIKVVLQAWRYIEAGCAAQSGLSSTFDYISCLSRAKALLGGLLEAVELSTGYFHKRTVLRVLHKSLSTYLRRGSWFAQQVGHEVRHKYLDNVWTNLIRLVLLQACDDRAIEITELVAECKRKVDEKVKCDVSKILVNHKKDTLLVKCLELIRLTPFKLTTGKRSTWESIIVSSTWNSLADLLQYCCENADRYTTSNHIKSGCVNDFMFMHIQFCLSCRASATYMLGNSLVHLYNEEMLSWVVAINHDHLAISFVQLEGARSNLSPRTLQSLFDVFFVALWWQFKLTDKLPLDKLERIQQYLEFFAQRSVYIDSCHVCLISTWMEDPLKILPLFVAQRPSHIEWSSNHYRACPYRCTSVGLLHHLWRTALSYMSDDGEAVRTAALLGMDISAPVYSDGKQLFHRILRDVDRSLFIKDTGSEELKGHEMASQFKSTLR